MNMHKCYNATDKKHASTRAAEKAVTQWSGKLISASCWGRGLSSHYHFDVLGLLMPSYASDIIFWRETDEGVMT